MFYTHSMKVLFVCLGNICRSPMAEGILRSLAEQDGLGETIIIDSAGTSRYHSGSLPDVRMREVARKNGIELTHKSRGLSFADFYDFDYIIAMDKSNYEDILAEKPVNDDHRAKILMMREFDPEPGDMNVPDPYHGGNDGFNKVYDMLHRSCKHLLVHLRVQIAVF